MLPYRKPQPIPYSKKGQPSIPGTKLIATRIIPGTSTLVPFDQLSSSQQNFLLSTPYTPSNLSLVGGTGGYVPLGAKDMTLADLYNYAISQGNPDLFFSVYNKMFPQQPTNATGGFVPQGTSKVGEQNPIVYTSPFGVGGVIIGVESSQWRPSGTYQPPSQITIKKSELPPKDTYGYYVATAPTPPSPIALATATEKDINKYPPVLREIALFSSGISREVYSSVKGFLSMIPGTQDIIRAIDVGFALGTSQSISPFDKKKQTEYIGYAISTPQEYSPYISQQPYVFGGGATTLAVETFIGGKAIGGATGFLRGAKLTKTATTIELTVLATSTKQLLEGATQAYNKGELDKYLTYQAPSLFTSFLGTKKAYQEKLIEGERSRILSYAVDDIERARLNTIFDALRKSSQLSEKPTMQFDIDVIQKLKNNPIQQERFIKFLQDSRIKNMRIVLGGSTSMYIYGLKESPKDIDILVKPKRFIGIEGWKPTLKEKSLVNDVRNIMKEYHMQLDIYDVHDLPKLGSRLEKMGAGYTEKPIKTTTSPTGYVLRLSELTARKGKEVFAPEHLGRGKDWEDFLTVMKSRFSKQEKLSPKKYAKYIQKQGILKIKEKPLEIIQKESPGAAGYFSPTERMIVIGKDLPKTEFGYKLGLFSKLTPKQKLKFFEYVIKKRETPFEEPEIYGIKTKAITKEMVLKHELTHFREHEYPIKESTEPGVQIKSLRTKEFSIPTIAETLEKYEPGIKEGRYEVPKVKSYFELHPEEAPKLKRTLMQKIIYKYAEPFKYEEIGKLSPEAQEFQPKLIQKTITPEWAKGTLFFSSIASLPKSTERIPSFVSISLYKPTTTPITYPIETKKKQSTETIPKPTYQKEMKYPIKPTYITTNHYPIPVPPIFPIIPEIVQKQLPSIGEKQQKRKKPILQSTEKKEKQEEQIQSYNVYAKRDATKKARWEKVGTNLPEYEALSIGSQSVDETVSRTFKLMPSHQPAKPLGYKGWNYRSQKFRPPKHGTPGTYVEKTTFAIDTPGEFQGITVKGWLASRQKQKLLSPNIKPLPTNRTPRNPVSVGLNVKPYKPQMVKI